jgi:signal peptidase II
MMNGVPRNRFWTFTLISVVALALDLGSKSWVFSVLGYPHRQSDWSFETPLFWGHFSMRLTTWFNQGALFGIGQGLTWLFATLSIVAAAGIVYFLFGRGHAQSRWLTVTMALIFGGALGNLYDRLYLHGCIDPVTGTALTGVRDFIQCDIPLIGWKFPFDFHLIRRYHWPVFNLADSYLVAGAIMLSLYSLFVPQPAKASPRAAPLAAPPMPSGVHA